MDQSHDRQIIIEKNNQGETRAQGFDLQPVVVTDDWGPTNDSVTMETKRGKLSSFVYEKDERGFGLKPVRSLPDDSQTIGLSVDSSVEPRGLDLTPAVADGRPADDAPGFSLQPAPEARGLDLRPAVDTLSGIVESSRGYDLQPAKEKHGFSLQPVTNMLQADIGGAEEEEEDDDTPPPESLQSIKSIARARKSAGRESMKKSTETSITAKKMTKSGKEKPGKKATAGEKPQQKKEKGKVSSGSVDRSNLFKPSPSSGPSWSPTPTMRGSKAKVCLSKRQHDCYPLGGGEGGVV